MRAASDIGGTFTDLVYLNEKTGEAGTGKSSTTPGDFAGGVITTLKESPLSIEETEFFVHGSTVVINLLTERKGAKTGLITTKGFRDVLEITRANRPDLYNMCYTKPKPFIPRRYRMEARGRINYQGQEIEPFCREDVREAADFFLKEGVEAIAVCFLHSYANPAHERECREILREAAPGLAVTLSSEITREWREYERTSTAVLNAYVQKRSADYLDNLEQRLSGLGMNKVFHIMQSNGGTATFTRGREAPIQMVESGPVGGVIGASVIGKMIGEENLISFDVGGTTAKTSLIPRGVPAISTDYKIEWNRHYAGYPVLVPTVDIVEIGSGGGSIAGIDEAGTLTVGPESAGAVPGPACYGRGGENPTVTDAQVLAGRINPDYFLGGKIRLDTEKARTAVKIIAETYSITENEAAAGIIRMADSAMVNALKLVSVSRGYDPREFVLIAFGGGGALHGASVMRELRVKETVIPVNPGVFSAWGMLMSDLRQDFIKTLILQTKKADPAAIESIFREMEGRGFEMMLKQNVGEKDILFQRFADMRYEGQEHTVKVPLPIEIDGPEAVKEMNRRFHELHRKAYSFELKSSVELVNYHLICTGRVKKPEIKALSGQGLSENNALKGKRQVYYNDFGRIETPAYERELLPIEKILNGPAVIEEPSSSIAVFPDQKFYRDRYGFLHIKE